MAQAGSSITPEHWEKAKKLEANLANDKGFSTYKKYARHRQGKKLAFEVDTHVNVNAQEN